MSKFWLFLVVSLFCLQLVVGQSTITGVDAGVISNFEKVVVKEHFQTKSDFKDYIDKKVVEYQISTKKELSNVFVEFERVVDSRINKLVFKLSVAIFSVVFFSGSLWYFVRKKLDRRYDKIMSLANKPDKALKEASEGFFDENGNNTQKNDKMV